MNNCISLSQTNYTGDNIYKLDKFRAKLDVRKFVMNIELLIYGIPQMIGLLHVLQ